MNFPPSRLIGLLIWDNEREVLHGPQMVKHLFNDSDSNDPHPPECTIHKYAFITTETFQVELMVFVRDEAHRDFCISGFDDAALHMREISFNKKIFIVNNTN